MPFAAGVSFAVCSGAALAQSVEQPGGAIQPGAIEEVVVTATRREESLSKVPISVSVFSQEEMDARGLKQVDDLVRFTPGLTLTRVGNGASNQIAIRGISSGAGAGTTGVYIDDTPIQVRNLAYGSGTTFPALFDLERVEVLRGPQGTLFGASSEGGTVRFIQSSPNLTEYSRYARAEVLTTRNGDPSYEAGFAISGPIVTDRSGFRASVFYRRDGGYVDGVTGTPTVVDPTGASGGSSVSFANKTVVRENTNWNTTMGFRAAFKFAVNDNLSITPSVTYQKLHVNDGDGSFWLATSNSQARDYARPVYSAGNPATNPQVTAITSPNTDEGDDEFYLPALAVNWNLGKVELVSNTSYFDRELNQYLDFSGYYHFFYGLAEFPRPGDKASSLYHNAQRNFVQELRFQSTDTAARVTWVAGAFYSNSEQHSKQNIEVNFLNNSNATVGAFYLPFIGLPLGETDGPPYGPGHSAFENYFGIPPDPGSSLWRIDFKTVDKQLAGFAQADFKLTERLKLTAGLRVSSNKLDFNAVYSGPENNQNGPPGLFSGMILPPLYSTATLNSSETAVTPKIGASYQLNDANMFYVTVSKGFRPAGASQRVPVTCDQDLINLGYVDSNGNPSQPLLFDSDSVRSSEIGSKNRLLEGRLVVDASMYEVKWNDIQSGLFLPNCAEQFTTNISKATSTGFDVGLQIRPIDNLSLGVAIGRNKTIFGADGISPGGVRVISKDGVVAGSPAPWTASLSAQYDFTGHRRPFYVRGDVTRSTEERRVGMNDPNSPSFNPLLGPVPGYSIVNLRAGMQVFGADLSLFVNNVTDEQPDLALQNGGLGSGLNSAVWANNSLRPRTYGVTLAYRYR